MESQPAPAVQGMKHHGLCQPVWDEEETGASCATRGPTAAQETSLAYCTYCLCGHQCSAGESWGLEERCSKCSQNCSPGASLAWLMPHSTPEGHFRARGLHQGAVQRGLCSHKPSPCRKEKQRQPAEHLPFPPHPGNSPLSPAPGQKLPLARTARRVAMASPALQQWEKGMAPVACNTYPPV